MGFVEFAIRSSVGTEVWGTAVVAVDGKSGLSGSKTLDLTRIARIGASTAHSTRNAASLLYLFLLFAFFLGSSGMRRLGSCFDRWAILSVRVYVSCPHLNLACRTEKCVLACHRQMILV